MKVSDIARVCHEVNRAYCLSLGDSSQPSWKNAPEWQKFSAINGVRFHLDNPGTLPSASHEKWLEEKLATGWKYGLVKNPDTKEHPCCVPYDQLPVEQRAKDYIFSSIVRELAEKIEV
jgi:hypothetical protein